MSTNLQTELTDAIKIGEIQIHQAEAAKPSMFCLWYRERRNPHPQTKYFFFKGDLKAAIARGRMHCEATGLVFIHVRPFVSDLEADEKRHLGNYD